MKTAWHNLPNAEHIDRILADLKARHEVWAVARAAVGDAERDVAWAALGAAVWPAARAAVGDAARAAVGDAAWAAARDANKHEARSAAYVAAYDAVLALIAWDHASSYLKLPPEQVLMLSRLGINEAVLMCPAVLALNTKEKENAL